MAHFSSIMLYCTAQTWAFFGRVAFVEKVDLNLSMNSSRSKQNHSHVLVLYIQQIQVYYSKEAGECYGNDQKEASPKFKVGAPVYLLD